jgi:excisionase family DNA binding protein
VREPPVSRNEPGWLPLGRASHLLGVDPDTLRRWADEGRVEVFHTPGGHRRFSRQSLERLARVRGRPRASLTGLGATPERITAAYRRRYVRHRPDAPDPLRVVPIAERDVFRDEGRLLVAALVRHLDATDRAEREAAFAEAASLVGALGARLAASHTSLTEAVALFVAARRPFLSGVGVAARRRSLGPEGLSRLYDEASAAFDRLLLVFIDAHPGADGEVSPALTPLPDTGGDR